jgi:eukaryotic-like serine/threonine-protein kinase
LRSVHDLRETARRVSTRDEIETDTEPGIEAALALVEPETGQAEGIESLVMLQRARARLLGRGEQTPARVGRYVVVQRIGAGAMGVVLRAYDPKLRREVALKIVRPRASIEGDEAQARLLREAQALARLNHPNVVAVYDAESTDDGVCIAMEFVEGRTLRGWLREQTRSWSEVLSMIIAVARGLAAAHAAGIVHRDVKPDNCLVGTDGRLRVTDFGLARTSDGTPSSFGESSHGVGDDGDEPLTQDGTVLGTPAYMAPEQHHGLTADASTDQYALGVLMWEALYGVRPFRGSKLEVLSAAKHHGPPERPAKPSPKWLHAIIVRALAVEPEQRWSCVAVLADALESGKTRVLRRRALVAIAGLAAAAMGFAGWQQVDQHRTRVACNEQGASIHADAWDEATRVRVREGLSAPGGRDVVTYDKLVERIDPYVAGWQESWAVACVAAEVEGRFTPALHIRAQQCLGDRRERLVALLDVLAEGKGAAWRRAVVAAAELPTLDPCTSAVDLGRARTLDVSGSVATADLRRSLYRARALVTVDRSDEALAIVQAVAHEAQAAGLEELELEAQALTGIVAGHLGRYEDSEAALRRALVEAGAAGLDEIAADAATALVATVGHGLDRQATGLAHADTATLLVDRVEPEGHGPRHARLLDHRALVHVAANRPREAQRLQARALEMVEAERGPDHPSVATQLRRVAAIASMRGSYDDAERLYTRALAILEKALGFDHPLAEETRVELGRVRQALVR